MLKYADSIGDYVIVGLDADERVKSSKGESRPINTLEDRMEVVRSIKYVDEVVSFDSDESLIELLKECKPRFRVLGSEYNKPGVIIGEEHSGDIVFFKRIEQYSSTDSIKRMNNNG